MVLMLPRNPSSHKGDNGTILVIGGSASFPGAAYLAAQSIAALRAGADLLFIAAPEKVAWAINTFSPDLITLKLLGSHLAPRHYRTILPYLKRADVLLLGNGIGTHPDTKRLVRKAIAASPKKLKVIDADAIKMLRLQDIDHSIITPHAGEFKMLLKHSDLAAHDYRNALRHNVLLLKGKADRIISRDAVKAVAGGSPGMTVGGTGDVLAGLCAGYFSQTKDLFRSALLASRLSKRIGSRLQKQLGYGFVASDFLRVIAEEGRRLR